MYVCTGSHRITESDYDDGIGVVAAGGWGGDMAPVTSNTVIRAVEYKHERSSESAAGFPFLPKASAAFSGDNAT